jgi:hypothetical protein
MTVATAGAYKAAHTMRSQTVDEAGATAKDRLDRDVAARIRNVRQIVEEIPRYLIVPALRRYSSDFMKTTIGLRGRRVGCPRNPPPYARCRDWWVARAAHPTKRVFDRTDARRLVETPR